MSVYIYKNKQQSGPFDENAILGWLRDGQLTMEDFACRTGANQWQRLKELFPPVNLNLNPPAGNIVGEKVPEAPLYRKTMLQKIVFGGIVILLLFAFAGTLFYMKELMGSSGDFETDLRTLPFLSVARKAAITIFIALIFSFAAFLLSFKKRIIQSYGLRMVLRFCFVFLILSAILQFSYAVYSYSNYYTPSYLRLLAEDKKSNPLKKALDEAEDEAARSSILAVHLPIAFGLLILGASGFLMTRFKYSDEE